jgi:PAS domain S-box-containing protein
MQPLLASLRIDTTEQSAGYLLDEYGRVLFASQNFEVMSPYPGARPTEERFFSDTAPNGVRQMVYYQPTQGRDWAVVVTIPAEVAQRLALDIAMPLLGMILLFGALALLLLQIGLHKVTGTLEKLVEEVNLIAEGNLEHPLVLARSDELGRLAQAFEQMRLRLKQRLDELNRLLHTSQGMVSSLQLDEILHPVLRAVKKIGADAVGVVLADDVLPDTLSSLPKAYYDGNTDYAYLGAALLQMVKGRTLLSLENPRRVPTLSIPPNAPVPGYVLALELRQGRLFYGVLWLACEKRSSITDDEVRFVSTLAADVALAVSNALLFQQAEEGRQYLEAVLSSTADPVLVADASHRLRLLNPAAAEAFELTPEETIGQPIRQVFHQDALIDLLEGRTEQAIAEVVLGEQVYLATASSVQLNGEPVGRVCILRDVTYLKQIDQMKSDFVSTVSHDLRSPLTLMRGYATMLEMVGELNEQQRTYLQKIVLGVENMSRLVNNLLDLGRIEAGVGLEKQKVLVADLVEKISGALQLYASQKSIQLKIALSENVPAVVYADEALLYQAIYNLTENAIKYTPEGGRVLLSVKEQANEVVFTVQDSGIGISPEDQKRLFQKFFRSSDRKARAQKGTGLGLAIVRSIAERHQGRVWVESQLGRGSTFYFAIPVEHETAA